jgi:hypothetical protein
MAHGWPRWTGQIGASMRRLFGVARPAVISGDTACMTTVDQQWGPDDHRLPAEHDAHVRDPWDTDQVLPEITSASAAGTEVLLEQDGRPAPKATPVVSRLQVRPTARGVGAPIASDGVAAVTAAEPSIKPPIEPLPYPRVGSLTDSESDGPDVEAQVGKRTSDESEPSEALPNWKPHPDDDDDAWELLEQPHAATASPAIEADSTVPEQDAESLDPDDFDVPGDDSTLYLFEDDSLEK